MSSKSGESRKRKKVRIVLLVFTLLICLIAIFMGRYLYCNLHFDKNYMENTLKAGFHEKQVKLRDGSVINYAEGPDGGPALLLIHGQTSAWQDYDTVLPELSKTFHVYSVDCFGHGKSSHDKSLYTCIANGKSLIWFIKNIIKEECYISGHSSGDVITAWIASEVPDIIKGVVLEDPPFFSVTPEEVRDGDGAASWYDGYVIFHDFCTQTSEKDFTLYYLKHSYILGLFGGLQKKIYDSALKYRQKHPNEPVRFTWFPAGYLRVLLYMDYYDPEFGNSFYNGSWMKGLDQEAMLQKIKCPAVYLKASTLYGKDGVLYAANTEDDADKVTRLLKDCRRINVDSGHNIHFEHPDIFISSVEALLKADQ